MTKPPRKSIHNLVCSDQTEQALLAKGSSDPAGWRYLADLWLASEQKELVTPPDWLNDSPDPGKPWGESDPVAYSALRSKGRSGSCLFPLIAEQEGQTKEKKYNSYLACIRVTLLPDAGADKTEVKVRFASTSVYRWINPTPDQVCQHLSEICHACWPSSMPQSIVEISIGPVPHEYITTQSQISNRSDHVEQTTILSGFTYTGTKCQGRSFYLAFALALKAALDTRGRSLRPLIATGNINTNQLQDGSESLGLLAVDGCDEAKPEVVSKFLSKFKNDAIGAWAMVWAEDNTVKSSASDDSIQEDSRAVDQIIRADLPAKGPLPGEFLSHGLEDLNKAVFPEQAKTDQPETITLAKHDLAAHVESAEIKKDTDKEIATVKGECIAKRFHLWCGDWGGEVLRFVRHISNDLLPRDIPPVVCAYPPSQNDNSPLSLHSFQNLAWFLSQRAKQAHFSLCGDTFSSLPTPQHIRQHLLCGTEDRPVPIVLCDRVRGGSGFTPGSFKSVDDEIAWLVQMFGVLNEYHVQIHIVVDDVSRALVWAKATEGTVCELQPA